LVRVRAVSLNQSDWEGLTGRPLYVRIFGLRRPKFPILGTDVTGVVEAVGSAVRKFAPGDEVYGDALGRNGGLAEYCALPERALQRKPPHLSFETVATVPQAGIIAVQGLRFGGGIKAGERVLINGAGGGSGMFAIQLAKMQGAIVTAVDSAKKLEHMRRLGADHVLDYQLHDFAQGDATYDHILDLVGTRSIFSLPRVLRPRGRYVMVGGQLSCILSAALLGGAWGALVRKKLGVLSATPNPGDWEQVLELIESEQLQITLHKTYGLEESASAISELGRGEVLGKAVVRVAP
jgi:NADPH:quinone reductase-like Zn-dependent oxidoreductase